MAVDSNRPYNRVNVQSNNNDTIWNGAAWGAGAGIGAAGLTYGATMHGSRALSALNYKVAGNKTIREMTRADKLAAKGKPRLSDAGLDAKHDLRMDRAEVFEKRMGKVQGLGQGMFSGKRKFATGAVGLMGGMIAGSSIDHLN